MRTTYEVSFDVFLFELLVGWRYWLCFDNADLCWEVEEEWVARSLMFYVDFLVFTPDTIPDYWEHLTLHALSISFGWLDLTRLFLWDRERSSDAKDSRSSSRQCVFSMIRSIPPYFPTERYLGLQLQSWHDSLIRCDGRNREKGLIWSASCRRMKDRVEEKHRARCCWQRSTMRGRKRCGCGRRSRFF